VERDTAERVEGEWEDGPSCELATIESHCVGDALPLTAQGLREVDAPHVLDEDVEPGAALRNAYREPALPESAVERSDERIVQVDASVVTNVGDREL
jgi:hypothetical protein